MASAIVPDHRRFGGRCIIDGRPKQSQAGDTAGRQGTGRHAGDRSIRRQGCAVVIRIVRVGIRLATTGAHPAPEAVRSDADIFDRIERLAALHAKGILTAQEFEATKSEFLSRLSHPMNGACHGDQLEASIERRRAMTAVNELQPGQGVAD
ncbi:SHOCT domain-containing protein [Ensifer sp. Root278]|uniref:SHOCT domain-containing protein n=1 Tax=Ensifer sp. Root278 TaxID=1736509 RepID=UPI0012E37A2A